jgi:hypothetical protein
MGLGPKVLEQNEVLWALVLLLVLGGAFVLAITMATGKKPQSGASVVPGSVDHNTRREPSPAAHQTLPAANGGEHSKREASVIPPTKEDFVEALERLARLRDAGALTDAEFQAEKSKIING